MATRMGSIRAERPHGSASPNRRYPDGRICSAPGCDARISIYNRNDRCWAHLGLKVPRLRGRKIGS